MAEKVKLTVNILDKEYAALKAMAEDRGISVTDALRRSINLTNQIYEEQEGGKLLIEDRKGRKRQLLLP